MFLIMKHGSKDSDKYIYICLEKNTTNWTSEYIELENREIE